MRAKIDYDYGDIVYLKTDTDQLEHVIVGFELRPGNGLKLIISYMGEEYTVYDIEITRERDILKSLGESSKGEEGDDD